MKQPNSLAIIFLSIIISTPISYVLCVDAVEGYIERNKQIKIVDVKQLANAAFLHFQNELALSDKDINPVHLESMLKDEGKKLFDEIIKNTGNKHIVIPKSLIVYAPSDYEVTEKIGAALGYEGIVNLDYKKSVGQSNKFDN